MKKRFNMHWNFISIGVYVGVKMEETISKKIAAMEVFKEVKKRRKICLASVVALVVASGFGNLNKWAGVVTAGVIAMGYSWIIFKDSQLLNYLNETYKLQQETAIIKKDGK